MKNNNVKYIADLAKELAAAGIKIVDRNVRLCNEIDILRKRLAVQIRINRKQKSILEQISERQAGGNS